MKEVIERYKNIIVQIATPFSTGTGFFLKNEKLIVTNEHVVRDNREVVICGEHFEKQMAVVLFTDAKHDLALLKAPASVVDFPEIEVSENKLIEEGSQIVAIGHPFGMAYAAAEGIVSNITSGSNGVSYIYHDAALHPGNSGGPLVNADGVIVGINTFVIKSGKSLGFSLPAKKLKETIEAFKAGGGQLGARCFSCGSVVFENEKEGKYCPQCDSILEIPSEITAYEPIGIAKTIEAILEETGHRVQLARRGSLNWKIEQGSAKINVYYYEKTGLIIGDAYLCNLPQKDITPLYEFLLRQNYENEGLTFSVKGQDIVLSLFIYDRYLNKATGIKLIEHLFERADYYDNILVEKYGATWKQAKFY